MTSTPQLAPSPEPVDDDPWWQESPPGTLATINVSDELGGKIS